MKNIIKKWYYKLSFPKEYDEAFEKILEKSSLEPATIDQYTYGKDYEKDFLMFLYFCEDLEKYYKKTGISEDILLDTLSDIVVWTKIHFRINKKIGLSETHWLVRHLSGRLFKLGRLQFCMESEEIEVHIQEGASLDEKECDESFEKAKVFFKNYFPMRKFKYFTCESWLLDDTLKKFLKPGSNILKFASRFTPYEKSESYSALTYIFERTATEKNLSKYKATSRFAEELKKYVLSGGKLYMVKGRIDIV